MSGFKTERKPDQENDGKRIKRECSNRSINGFCQHEPRDNIPC